MKNIARIKMFIPENNAQANELVDHIGEIDLIEQQIENDLNKEIAKIKEAAKLSMEKWRRLKSDAIKNLFIFYSQNKKTLTKDGKRKIVNLGSGDFGFRIPSKSIVTFRGKEKVIETLKKLDLDMFIQTKVTRTLDKEAISKEEKKLSGIEGIIFKREEKFMIRPEKSGKTTTEEIKKLKKFLS